MKSYTEGQIAEAIAAIENGTSLRQASKTWSIPRTTLYNRISGRLPRTIAHQSRQRLSIREEDELVNWFLAQANLGLPPSHQELRTFAERVLGAKGDSAQLGKRWVASFLKRNPKLKTQISFRMDSKRVDGVTTK